MKHLFLLIALAFISCKSVKNTNQEDLNNENTNEIPEVNMNREHAPISIEASIGLSEDKTSGTVQIIKSKLTGNKLSLKIGYSGGCSKHEFKALGNPMISKSLPPIRSVSLIHITNGDTCREYIEQELIIDLSELAYKKETGSKIKLQFSGLDETIMYTYTAN